MFNSVVVFPYMGQFIKELKILGLKTHILQFERRIRYDLVKDIPSISIDSRVRNIMDVIDEEALDVVHTNSSVVPKEPWLLRK